MSGRWDQCWNAETAAGYHRRIVNTSIVFGVVGAALGVGLIVVAARVGAQHAGGAKDIGKILLAPFMFGAVGMIFGLVLACAIAPRRYLTGPYGQKWMQLIGTSNVFVARLVCLILALIIGGIPAAMGLIIAIKGP